MSRIVVTGGLARLSIGMSFREWNATSYDRVANPHVDWGRQVIDRLPLQGSELVMDAGCGTGRVTELLLNKLPDGRVIAIDSSRTMLREAQRRLAHQSNRVSFITADLTQRLPLCLPVDAILSTAAFHWIADHDRLFANLAAAMRRGGVLAAQCGGSGNIASVRAVLNDTGDGWVGPWFFATPEETRARLLACGFTEVRTWSAEDPVRFDSSSELERYLATVILGPHLQRLAPEERDVFVKQVAARIPDRTIDYVRLNIVATRA